MKKGRFSKSEIEKIDSLHLSHTPEAIANELNREASSVAKFIKKTYGTGATAEEQAAFELDGRPYWTELKQQFTERSCRTGSRINGFFQVIRYLTVVNLILCFAVCCLHEKWQI